MRQENIPTGRMKWMPGLVLLLLTFASATDTTGQAVKFSASYGNAIYNEGVAAFQLPDTTYLLVGNSAGYMGNTAPYLARIDSQGNLMYDAMLSRPWLLKVTSAQLHGDSLYLAGFSLQQGDYQFMLMKTDLSGNAGLEKYWGGSGWDLAHDLLVMPGDTVFVCGESADTAFGYMDAALSCISPDGTLLWRNTYGGSGHDAFYAIDSGYHRSVIMAGASASFSTGADTAMYIVNCSTDGSLQWQTIEDYPGPDAVRDIHPDMLGGYYLCGETQYWTGFRQDGFLMQLDEDGQVEWKTQFGSEEDDALHCAIQLPDGTYRMAGFNSGMFSSGMKDYMLINADTFGVWSPALSALIIGGMYDDIAHSLIQTLDGGFMMAGTARSFPQSVTTLYIVKTDGDGKSTPYAGHYTAIGEPSGWKDQWKIYPNPADDILIIENQGDQGHSITGIRITDMRGSIIKSWDENILPGKTVKVPVDDLSPGLYFIMVNGRVLKFQKI